ncbi:RagB/SusD family nutrient uptake outer membrane protein [Carboxylicivirga sp. A043]|uniref:RagB/SusD family nutrient uptake outer membrane protein n=1 Tax=Carboxylicivirga litoralis TaxID=2816963 RepID=UPI0021CB8D98|nr:RagB/SusD family nutrient uptake outer membrane protein [Carboxylicivirga sp. A043]MCU4157752.1 RagB/SusD family nutrient uptake outer membrane protein [Carboxylicivirga sp. A043]
MKNDMIKYFKIVGFVLVLATIFGACEGDFLEKPAGSDVTIDTVFVSTSNAQQSIFLLYHDDYFGADNIALNWWDNPQGYASWSEIGDDLYPSHKGLGNSKNYIAGSVNSASNQMYGLNWLYFAVRGANTFIEKAGTIPTVSEEDAAYVDKMTGEAHAHLSYQYFKAMKLWGTVPWVNKRLDGSEDVIPRPSFSDFVDSMVVHLDVAANLLPEQWEDRWQGRFTSVAAKALKAKILVYAASPLYNGETPGYASGYEHPEVLGYGSFSNERWKRAADACREAIDAAHAAGYGLYKGSGEEKNIYDLAIKLTNEHILYQTFETVNSEGGWKYCNNMMNWPYGIGWYNRTDVMYQPTIQHIDAYQLSNGAFPIDGYENNDPTKPIISQAGIDAGYTDQNYHANRDTRFYQNVVYHGSKFGENYNDKLINFDADPTVPDRTHGDHAEFKTSFMTRKFVNEALGESQSITYQPVHPILRLADLYLLYAEALSEYNGAPTADAIFYLNEVRSRSGMPNYDAANYKGATDKEKFHNAIKYERKVEFFLEAQRYFDLRRWKEGDELTTYMGGVIINNGAVSRININFSRIFNEKMYFHPFHSNWVNNTEGLYQNPGW